MDVARFDYDLPPELIAQEPQRPRDYSRLLVVPRAGGAFEHRRFFEIEEYLRPGDMLVMNNTRVIRARLLCKRSGGGKAELLLLRQLEGGEWETLVRPGRAARVNSQLIIGDGEAVAIIVGNAASGGRIVRFEGLQPGEGLLELYGEVPTPPYIHRKVDDSADYQTVYAQHDGSAAAPTAGFHFTTELLSRLRDRGIRQSFVTLHIGLDTFRPIKCQLLDDHEMHAEFYDLSPQDAEAINAARSDGGRIIAAGTTTVRALESAVTERGMRAGSGWTRLFIRPGHCFQAIDALLTNFHLPRSTLLVLVSALAGRERIMDAYAEAVAQRYRFYSFGDAMLIL